MMEQKHLQRAQQIVEGIEACKNALTYERPWYNQSNSLQVAKDRPGTSPAGMSFPMSKAVRDVAFKAWRREQELRLAGWRREAAQIGLKLED